MALQDRLIRRANIKAHGWPPPGLDADGDVVTKKVVTKKAEREEEGE